jgi:hypothetical protein
MQNSLPLAKQLVLLEKDQRTPFIAAVALIAGALTLLGALITLIPCH